MNESDPTYISPIDELTFTIEMFVQALRFGVLSVVDYDADDVAAIKFATRTFQQKCDEFFNASQAVLHVRELAVDVYQMAFELSEAGQSLHPESDLDHPGMRETCVSHNVELLRRFSITFPDRLTSLRFRLIAFAYVSGQNHLGPEPATANVEDLPTNQGRVFQVLKEWIYSHEKATIDAITAELNGRPSRSVVSDTLKEMKNLGLVFHTNGRGFEIKKNRIRPKLD